jgi:hypothetical protein
MKRSHLPVPSLLFLTFAFSGTVAALIQTPSVTGGEVRGTTAGGVTAFKGIPFAAPPVGDLRWKAPQPVVPWTGVRKADSFAPGCMQDTGASNATGSPANVSEDCLYLNVWTAAWHSRMKAGPPKLRLFRLSEIHGDPGCRTCRSRPLPMSLHHFADVCRSGCRGFRAIRSQAAEYT